MSFPRLFAGGLDRELTPADREPGRCELCGDAGSERVEWQPPKTWTAQSTHAYPGEGAICRPCALLLRGGPDGAKRPFWPIYTLAASPGQPSRWLTKAHKREIAALVADPAWSVSIADQGKRHISYLAPLSAPGRVRVSIDAAVLDVSEERWRETSALIEGAYRCGVLKASLARAELTHNDLRRLGISEARQLQRALITLRGSTELRIAVWLAQREDE